MARLVAQLPCSTPESTRESPEQERRLGACRADLIDVALSISNAHCCQSANASLKQTCTCCVQSPLKRAAIRATSLHFAHGPARIVSVIFSY